MDFFFRSRNLFARLILVLAAVSVPSVFGHETAPPLQDNHVHQMSPALIEYFKDVGIPFSKPDSAYSDIHEISKRLGTNRMKIVSMAYLWGHPEFGAVEDEYEKVKAENDYILENNKLSDLKIFSFCGVNPLKDYALKEIERCRDNNAFGIKLHFNANQIYLTEPEHVKKLKPIFEYAAKNRMPMLVHFDNGHAKTGSRDVRILFDEILSEIKPVELQIAHFGTSGGFSRKTKNIIDAFLDEFERAGKKNSKHRITFDISAVALDKDSEGVSKLNDEEFAELAVYIRKLGLERVAFATDYPLYSANEYLQILEKRVGLTPVEIKIMGRVL